MKHNFEYFYDTKANDSFLVEDLSNFTLNLLNDLGFEWYIDVTTCLGYSIIRKFGPMLVGQEELVTTKMPFKFEHFTLPFDENKIIKKVDAYINDPKFMITQVVEVDKEKFNERLKEIMDAAC